MHPVEKAEKRLSGEWPENPMWIFESPDGGRTVFRRLLVGSNPPATGRTLFNQLYMDGGIKVASDEKLDDEYFSKMFAEKEYTE